MTLPKAAFSPLLLAIATTSHAAVLSDTFDSFPGGGTGWTGDWVPSSGTSAVTTSIDSASPLNGGGNYLTVSTDLNASETGIRRNIGTVAASPYTVTFDWRLDSDIADFVSYTDRIHFGASSTTAFGTNSNWSWIIGVVGGDNTAPDPDVPFEDGKWYFYDNTSTTMNGSFSLANMRVSEISLAQDVVYSFTVTVDPSTQKYDASMTDGVNTFTQTGMDFRNQGSPAADISNLIFGGSNTPATTQSLTWSIDSLDIIPEPSSALLIAVSGILCFVRRKSVP